MLAKIVFRPLAKGRILTNLGTYTTHTRVGTLIVATIYVFTTDTK